MEWVKKAFWFLVIVCVLIFLLWIFLLGPDQKKPVSEEKTATSTYVSFWRRWVTGGFWGAPEAAWPNETPSSRFRGAVVIRSTSGAKETDSNREYIELRASPWNAGIVVVTGWTIKSSSGKTIPIGGAAHIPKQGEISEEGFIALEPGDVLLVSTGRSPIGVSFRENVCSGYTEEFQDFFPPIPLSCPSPSFGLAEKNLYEDTACVAFVSGARPCKTYAGDTPTGLSAACRFYIQNDLTYNGCVSAYRRDRSFFKNVWRFYAGENEEIWANTGDMIRLYDTDGALVDTLTYFGG